MKTKIISIGILLAFTTTNAQAYLDPGTGSMMLQVLLGGIAAVGVMLKLYWHKFISFFKKSEPATGDDE